MYQRVVYLLEDSSAVDDVLRALHDLEHAQRECFHVRVLQQTGVVEVEICEDSLCQRMSLEPRYLENSNHTQFKKLLKTFIFSNF